MTSEVSEIEDGLEESLTAIDHIGIAVRDLDSAVEYYRRSFGMTVVYRERVESDGVEEALLSCGESYVQLLTPITESSPVFQFLDRRGEGLHHIAYRVDNCESALKRAVAGGSSPVDTAPRPGSRGTRVAFIHPRSAFGSLIELVEEPKAELQKRP